MDDAPPRGDGRRADLPVCVGEAEGVGGGEDGGRRHGLALDDDLLQLGDGAAVVALVHQERSELVSRSARLAYPIRDGIPIMLPEEARKIE